MALNPFRYALAALAVLPFAASAAKFEPAALEDVNPNPDVVEVFLEAEVAKARFGRGPRTAVWTYNGITPGPTINAKVGDTIIVHFTNSLPEDTTVHWHGVETPATMDGSNISQLTVYF